MPDGYVETNGVRLWYEETGPPDGPAVLLVMGAGGTVVWWPPDLIRGLGDAGFRVVAFDSRDVGLSTHIDPGESYELDDMAADTVGLIGGLGIAAAHLVGLSLGGTISQLIALHHPDRVRSLTLVSTTPGSDARLPRGDDKVFAVFDRPATTTEEIGEQTVEFCRALAGSRFPFDEQYYRAIVAADFSRGTNPGCHPPASAPSRLDGLGRIRHPTLVIHGTEDPVYPFGHAEALAKGIPDATLVGWDGVGHELPPQLVSELTGLLVEHMNAAG